MTEKRDERQERIEEFECILSEMSDEELASSYADYLHHALDGLRLMIVLAPVSEQGGLRRLC